MEFKLLKSIIAWSAIASASFSCVCTSWFANAGKNQAEDNAANYLCGAAEGDETAADYGLLEFEEHVCESDRVDQPDFAGLPPIINVPLPNRTAAFSDSPLFCKDYFRGLSSNLPKNNVGNCGYVAISMMLSYYAYYWNLSVLPSQYLQSSKTFLDSPSSQFNSPCAVDQDISFPYDTANDYGVGSDRFRRLYDSYYNDKMGQLDSSFIAYLYKLAVDEGIWDRQEHADPASNLHQVKDILSVLFSRLNISDKVSVYTKSVNNYEGSTHELKKEKMFYEMITLLERGKPLMIGGRLRPKDDQGNYIFGTVDNANGLSGHITVAYDYEEVTEDLYGHTGYRSGSYSNLMDMFYEIDDFCYLDFHDMPHVHNDQFSVNGQNVCSCTLGSHRHSYTAYPIGSNTVHRNYCMCGYVADGNHIRRRFGIGQEECIYCHQVLSNSWPWR